VAGSARRQREAVQRLRRRLSAGEHESAELPAGNMRPLLELQREGSLSAEEALAAAEAEGLALVRGEAASGFRCVYPQYSALGQVRCAPRLEVHRPCSRVPPVR